LGFVDWGLGSRVQGSGSVSGFRGKSLWFRVKDVRFRLQGSGFRDRVWAKEFRL